MLGVFGVFGVVAADEFKQLSDIENLIGRLLERIELEGYEPTHNLPESQLRRKQVNRPKKPKNPKEGHRDGQRNPRNRKRRAGTGKRQSSGGAKSSGRRGGLLCEWPQPGVISRGAWKRLPVIDAWQ